MEWNWKNGVECNWKMKKDYERYSTGSTRPMYFRFEKRLYDNVMLMIKFKDKRDTYKRGISAWVFYEDKRKKACKIINNMKDAMEQVKEIHGQELKKKFKYGWYFGDIKNGTKILQ